MHFETPRGTDNVAGGHVITQLHRQEYQVFFYLTWDRKLGQSQYIVLLHLPVYIYISKVIKWILFLLQNYIFPLQNAVIYFSYTFSPLIFTPSHWTNFTVFNFYFPVTFLLSSFLFAIFLFFIFLFHIFSLKWNGWYHLASGSPGKVKQCALKSYAWNRARRNGVHCNDVHLNGVSTELMRNKLVCTTCILNMCTETLCTIKYNKRLYTELVYFFLG